MNGTHSGVAAAFTTQDCVDALRAGRVARLGFLHEGRPLVLPFSYLLVGSPSSLPGAGVTGLRVLLRVTSDGVVSRVAGPVCIEIDSVLESDGVAWSVVAEGRLRAATAAELPPDHRGDAVDWRVVDLDRATGRRFTSRTTPTPGGYAVEWEVEGEGRVRPA